MYAMLHQFFNNITNAIFSTVPSDFLKQMIILKSLNSVLVAFCIYMYNHEC